MKALLREWEKRHPGRVETMLNSLKHVRTSHLLDRQAFDFERLPPSRGRDRMEEGAGI
jgi:tRNA 2-thiocytidine biosynthesis protein TtcA